LEKPGILVPCSQISGFLKNPEISPSEAGVQGAINYLHLLRYAERFEWSRLFTIPASGLLILPQPGEVFSYLLRYRQID